MRSTASPALTTESFRSEQLDPIVEAEQRNLYLSISIARVEASLMVGFSKAAVTALKRRYTALGCVVFSWEELLALTEGIEEAQGEVERHKRLVEALAYFRQKGG